MRTSRHHLAPAALACLLLAAALTLSGAPAPARAAITAGSSFGSAVPCLLAEDAFATTCFADTIFNKAPGGDPALVQVGTATKSPLAAIGSQSGAPSTRVANGIGSVYGLAYDDGAVSGVRRLLAAAYTRRLTSFGPGGPGGVYAYDFNGRAWSLLLTVPGAGWDRTRADDTYDADAVAQVGLSGLGDMEISPDGRELFIVNIASRRVERYSLATSPPSRGAPLLIDDGVRDANDALDSIWAQYRGTGGYTSAMEQAARADTVPFALEFSPFVADEGPLLVLGLTDTNRRGVMNGGLAAPVGVTAFHLATYKLNGGAPQRWAWSLSQSLGAANVSDRFRDSTIAGIWASASYAARAVAGWNPWHSSLANMPRMSIIGLGATVLYPQPLLSDIEFTRDGRRMYLGLRDRTGDQVFAAEAPAGHYSAIAQGDTLVYDLAGATWALQTTARTSDPANTRPDDAFVRPAPGDFFDDNRHSFDPALATPFHVENHMGALATVLQQGSGWPFTERLATTSLFGDRQSGLSFYGQGGGYWSAANATLVSASSYAGGKAATLGDLEPLCAYAFVSGRVWNDANGNGAQDAGEPGIAGVQLQAFRGNPNTSPSDAAAVTDAAGAYRFALPPNTPYRIRIDAAQRAPGGLLSGYRFTLPRQAGGDATRDSDASDIFGYVELDGSRAAPSPGTSGIAIATPVREQELTGVDVGLTQLQATGVVGDLVWQDANSNGLQDAGEPGLPAAQLSAMSFTLVPSPDTATILPPSVALRQPGGGRYEFQGVPAGIYAVRFGGLPAGFTPSPLGAGGGASDGADSDASGSTGMQTRFVVLGAAAPGNATYNLDLGLVPSVTDVAVALAAPPAVIVGQPIDYTVTASNLSAGATARGVALVHDLPPGVALVSAAGSPGRLGQRLTWGIGDLAPGQSVSFAVRVTAPSTLEPPSAAQPLSSGAAITTTSPETTTANNSAWATTSLVRPEIEITKSSAGTSALVGDQFFYTLRVTNSGSTPAANVAVADPLPEGVTFEYFSLNPGGACSSPTPETVSCTFGSLSNVAPNNSVSVTFVVRAHVRAPGFSTLNSASVSTSTPGDTPAGNSSSWTKALLRPNPGVQISIVPDAPSPLPTTPATAGFPVGTGGAILVRYANGLVSPPPAPQLRGPARGSSLEVSLPAGDYALAAPPPNCTLGGRTLSCALGDLGAGVAPGTIRLPISLGPSFSASELGPVTARISTATPERPEDMGDNTSTATISVVRPNLFVEARGPGTIVGRGSVFWYTVEYGNIHRPSPALTRAAEGAVLRVSLPADVELVQADAAPDLVDGRALSWDLGTLAPGATGRVVIVVRTDVAAGAALRLDATIAGTTPGDDPADNSAAVDTAVVLPPERVPPAAADLRLALRSELDPNSRDDDPDNGVYLTEGARFTWPAGEIVDLSPRLRRLSIPGEADLPFPYEYRARVVGWSLRAVTVDGTTYDPAGADGGGRSGCRRGAAPSGQPRLLEGCAYGYPGGDSIEAIRRAAPLREDDLRGQARLYWTRRPAPPVPGGVYLYAADTLAAVSLAVQVELELQIVNAAPGEVGGIALPEVPVVPLPDPERQLLSETFQVTMLVPRSLVGPGGQ